MKKFICCLFTLIIITGLCKAQTLNISGTVKDVHSKPISLVSVTIEKQTSGIATDNSGNFKLTISKYSKLKFSSVGYKDTVLVVENESPLNVILRYSEKDLGDVTVTDYLHRSQMNNDLKREMVAADFLHYSAENGISTAGIVVNSGIGYHTVSFAKNGGMYYGAAIPEFHTKEDTKGSLYLFNKWYNGIIANNNDSNIVNDSANFYNINKITGDLIMTRDFHSALIVDKSQMKFFILYDSLKNSYSFMIVPAISSSLFSQIISMGDNYDIFKLTTTKFVKANFSTDGIASSGNNYDEYINTDTYYLLDIKTNTLQKFDLKKKTIKQIFANVSKANDYLSQHKSDEVNDAFLKGLGSIINDAFK